MSEYWWILGIRCTSSIDFYFSPQKNITSGPFPLLFHSAVRPELMELTYSSIVAFFLLHKMHQNSGKKARIASHTHVIDFISKPISRTVAILGEEEIHYSKYFNWDKWIDLPNNICFRIKPAAVCAVPSAASQWKENHNSCKALFCTT